MRIYVCGIQRGMYLQMYTVVDRGPRSYVHMELVNIENLLEILAVKPYSNKYCKELLSAFILIA